MASTVRPVAMLNLTDQFTFHSRIPNPLIRKIFYRFRNGAIKRRISSCNSRGMRNSGRIERYEAKTNGDDPFSPVLRRWTVASSRQTLRSKNLETRWATGLNSRYRERKHLLSSCLYLSVPFPLSPSHPLPRVSLHLPISLSLAHAPSLFFFSDKFSRLPFTTLPTDSTRRDNRTRNVVIGRAYAVTIVTIIARKYRSWTSISFM